MVILGDSVPWGIVAWSVFAKNEFCRLGTSKLPGSATVASRHAILGGCPTVQSISLRTALFPIASHAQSAFFLAHSPVNRRDHNSLSF